MNTFNIHEAKTHLSKLIDKAVKGEAFIIAKAGKPMVKVSSVAVPAEETTPRTGFLAGALVVPDDFNKMGGDEIAQLFDGEE